MLRMALKHYLSSLRCLYGKEYNYFSTRILKQKDAHTIFYEMWVRFVKGTIFSQIELANVNTLIVNHC